MNAIVDGSGDEAVAKVHRGGSALNLKRYAARNLTAAEWLSAKADSPYWILDTVEIKTAWHPVGV